MGGALGSCCSGALSGRNELNRPVNKERRGILELEEASAFAFMVRFLPQQVVKSKKYDHNSDRKSKIFCSVTD